MNRTDLQDVDGHTGDESQGIEPVSFAELCGKQPERGAAVIDGILREGAVGTLIGGSKTRKSWLVAALMAAAVSGRSWLGHPVTRGRVLLIDGELTRPTIHFRLSKVFERMGVDVGTSEVLDIFDLRGHTSDFDKALTTARAKGPGFYKLIVIDPLYCAYPNEAGFSENDNVHMRRLFDNLITFTGVTRAALIVVHHLSKGSQFEKSLTDLGAGAGAIARAGDAHLALRPHRDPGVIVFDGVARDFPEMVPTCWSWTFPTFTQAPGLDPDDLAGKKQRRSKTQEFLNGGKGKGSEEWTPEMFAERVLTNEGQIIEQIIHAGKEQGQKERAIRGLLKLAQEKKIAFKWWEKGSNEPARFARKLPPSPPTHTPPTPPKGAKSTLGAGAFVGGGRGGKSTKRKPASNDAGIETPTTAGAAP